MTRNPDVQVGVNDVMGAKLCGLRCCFNPITATGDVRGVTDTRWVVLTKPAELPAVIGTTEDLNRRYVPELQQRQAGLRLYSRKEHEAHGHPFYTTDALFSLDWFGKIILKSGISADKKSVTIERMT